MKPMLTAPSNHEAESSPTVQNDSNIGHWCLDMVNDRLYWSDETYRIFGIPKERFLPYYSTFYNTVHPDDRAALTDHRDQFLKGAIPMNIDHRIVLPSGEIRYVRQSGERILNLNNRLIWLTGTVQDISGCRAGNKDLENLPPLARQSSSPVIVIDNNGYITWVNNSFIRTFEFEPQEVVGKRPGNFLQGPETDPGTIVYLREKIQMMEPFEVEVLTYSKSGQKYWMLVKGQPIFDKTGKCTGFFTIHDHMSGRKLAQVRINAFGQKDLHVFHQNPKPMWIFDYETMYFVEVNEAAVRRYGYSPMEFGQMKVTDIRPKFHIGKRVISMTSLSQNNKGRSIWTHIKKNGESISVQVASRHIEYRGRKSVIATMAEVTGGLPIQKKAALDGLHAKSAVMAANAAAALRKLYNVLASPAKRDLLLCLAIQTLIDQITIARPMNVSIDTETFYEKGLPKKVKLSVFRVIQEQFGNIVKYAYASEVKISLSRTDEKIYLVIHDNGQCFDISQKRNGVCMTDIVECTEMNNGKATIKSQPDLGNRLNAEFPINFHDGRT